MRRLAVALVVSAVLASPLEASMAPSVQRAGWVEVRTRHLRVLSDAGVERASAIAERLERLHEVLAGAARTLVVEPRRPRVVILFGDEAGFRHYRPFYKGEREALQGYFQPTPDGEYLLLKASLGGNGEEVALHEYTHAIMHEALPQVPLWLNEGLAEFFSTFTVDRRSAQVGTILPDHLRYLKSVDLMPIAELFKVGTGSSDYHEGLRQGTFYAQSWLLVHMLLSEKAEDLTRFEGFLRGLREGAEPAAALRAEYGEDAALQARLQRYLVRKSYGVREWTFTQAFDAIELRARTSVSNVEVMGTIAAALLPQGESMRATVAEHLTAALSLSPGDPTACALAGVLAEQKGDMAAAMRWYEQALASPDVPASACRQVAFSRMRWLLAHDADGAAESPARYARLKTQVLDVRGIVQRGLRLDPHDAELLALLGKTYVLDPGEDARLGVQASTRASQLLPGRTDLLADRVVLLAFCGMVEEARALFEKRLLPLGEAHEISYAREALEDIQKNRVENDAVDRFNEAVRLANEGRTAAAAAGFDSVASGDGPADLRERAAESARRIRAEGAERTRYERALARYNAGVTAMKRGDLTEAAAAFREAAELAPNDDMRKGAREALARVEAEHGFDRVRAHVRAAGMAEAEALLKTLRAQPLAPEQRAWVDKMLKELVALRTRR